MSLDFSNIDPETRQAMLDFVNRAPNWLYLSSRGYIVDDPSRGYGDQVEDYGIGRTVARRILDQRNQRPTREFDDLSRLDDVVYFGQDKLDDLAHTLRNNALHRNAVTLAVDGPACQTLLLDVIGRARVYVHLSSFLFYNDEEGQAVANALRERARAGVEVRVLLDQRASELPSLFPDHPTRHDIAALIAGLSGDGALVTDMLPIEERLTDQQLDRLVTQGVPSEWIVEQKEMNRMWLADFNHVDHRKMVVADGREAIIMSHNIGKEYLYTDDPSPAPGPAHRWHDAATHIAGGAATTLGDQFAKRWMLSGGAVFDHRSTSFAPNAQPEGSDTVRIQTSGPGDVLDSGIITLLGLEEAFSRQWNVMRNMYSRTLFGIARSEILIQNPYVLDDEIFDAWVAAAPSSAPTLTLIRPHPTVNDYPGSGTAVAQDYVRWLFRRNDLRLVQAGIQVREYLRAMSHLKMALVDDWMAVHGSYNLNYRSAKKDLEMNAIVESKGYARQMRQRVFDVDLTFANTVTAADAQDSLNNPAALVHGTLVETILRHVG